MEINNCNKPKESTVFTTAYTYFTSGVQAVLSGVQAVAQATKDFFDDEIPPGFFSKPESQIEREGQIKAYLDGRIRAKSVLYRRALIDGWHRHYGRPPEQPFRPLRAKQVRFSG